MRQARQAARQGIQSIEVGGRLLRVLAAAREPLMLRDLARAAAMPAAKAHRYLVSLARLGFIEQQPGSGRYDLGPFALQLGLAALGRLDPVAVAERQLEPLARELGQTVALAVWGNRGPAIVRWWGADTPVMASLRIGAVLPLTRSATGLAFLTWMPGDTTAALVRQELRDNARLGLAPRRRAELEPMLARVRRLGYARTSGFIAGISGVAAPVFDANRAMALAVIALGYARPFDARRKAIAARILGVAREIQLGLGNAASAAP